MRKVENIVQSESAPNTNSLWLKDGSLKMFNNGSWESISAAQALEGSNDVNLDSMSQQEVYDYYYNSNGQIDVSKLTPIYDAPLITDQVVELDYTQQWEEYSHIIIDTDKTDYRQQVRLSRAAIGSGTGRVKVKFIGDDDYVFEGEAYVPIIGQIGNLMSQAAILACLGSSSTYSIVGPLNFLFPNIERGLDLSKIQTRNKEISLFCSPMGMLSILLESIENPIDGLAQEYKLVVNLRQDPD